MEKEKIKYWIVIILFIPVALWVLLYMNRTQDVTQGTSYQISLPYEFGDWIGKDAAISTVEMQEIQDNLGTDKIILRNYVNSKGDHVQLYIVFSQKNRTSFHPPEYCYIGSGSAELKSKEMTSLELDKKTLNINRLIFQTPKGRQLVVYWYQAGKRMFASYTRQQMYLALDVLRNRPFEGFMIRLSTVDQQSNQDIPLYINDFITYLIPYLEEQV
jgi:EpsI family protein